MLEIFQNFEQAATRFAPLVLIVPGLATVAVGLFVWLRGLGLRRPLAGLVGGISGAICGFFLISRNIVTAAVTAGAAALAAIIFERLIITLLLAALAAVFCFAFLARPYMKTADAAASSDQSVMPQQGPTMSAQESIQAVKAYAVSFSNKVKDVCSQMPVYNWAIIVVSAVIFIVPGFLFWRLASALFSAALGTLLIFAGMILLLSYKGSAPISKIANRSSFYTTVFIAMIAFGTFEQLLLCRRAERESRRKKQATGDKHESE